MAYSIMVVDDSDTIRAMMRRALDMTKLPLDAIIEAKHGQDALDKLSQVWVDIVFTDINMPVMDGMQLFAEMKKNPEYSDIPVVIVSTEGSQTRVDELKKAGISGYLRKPFTPEKIRDIILETLGAWNE